MVNPETQDSEDLQVKLVPLEKEDSLDRLVQVEKRDHLDLVETEESLDLLDQVENLDPRDLMALLGLEETEVKQDHPVSLVHQAMLENLVPLDQLDSLDLLVPTEYKALEVLLASLVQLETEDHPDPEENLDQPDPQDHLLRGDNLVLLENGVLQEKLEDLDHLDLLATVEKEVNLEVPDLEVNVDCLDLVDHLDDQDLLVLEEREVNLDHLALQDPQEMLVLLDHPDNLDLLEEMDRLATEENQE